MIKQREEDERERERGVYLHGQEYSMSAWLSSTTCMSSKDTSSLTATVELDCAGRRN